jgi:hypothetical protein
MRFIIETGTDDGLFIRREEDADDILTLVNEKIGQVDHFVHQDWGYVVYDTRGKRYEVEVCQQETNTTQQ